jgi:virginiamycin B lyase
MAQSQVGKITPAGSITLYPITSGAAAAQITAGGDGNLWFTETASGSGLPEIGRITPAGQIQQYSLANTQVTSLGGITAGPDGNVWFTGETLGIGPFVVGKITPTGQISVFPVAGVNLQNITNADGALWFTEGGIGAQGGIGELSTTGVFTDHPLPNNTATSLIRQLHGITADSQGDIWFLEIAMSGNQTGDLKIGELTPAGQIHEYALISGFGAE